MSSRAEPPGRQLSLGIAVALTFVAAGVPGLVTHIVAESQGWTFPSFGYLVGELVWKLATLAVLWFAITRIDRSPVSAQTLGFAGGVPRAGRYPVIPALITALVAVVISQFAGSSATSASATIQHVGPLLAFGELAIRYPLTAVAEEALFRGWMQPRLGTYGPILSGLLWAGYHLQQVGTIPSLVIFGLALGWLRWLFGDIRVTSVLHYAADALFFVSAYL